jgi:hypothetical protein
MKYHTGLSFSLFPEALGFSENETHSRGGKNKEGLSLLSAEGSAGGKVFSIQGQLFLIHHFLLR